MELTAAAEALEALQEPCRVRLHSDSAYLVNAFKDRWMDVVGPAGLEKGRQEAGPQPRPVGAADDPRTRATTWRGSRSRATPASPLNEHVDGLAVGAMRTMMAEAEG